MLPLAFANVLQICSNKILHDASRSQVITLMQKVTLIPRGQARGSTWFTSDEDPTLVSEQLLFAIIVGGRGRRAAEERGDAFGA